MTASSVRRLPLARREGGERQRNYSARCVVSSQALVEGANALSTLSGGIWTTAPIEPIVSISHSPVARRRSWTISSFSNGGRSVAADGDCLDRRAAEVRSPLGVDPFSCLQAVRLM